MSTWTDQIKANQKAIQDIIDNALKISGLPALTSDLEPTDVTAFELASGETVKIKFKDLIATTTAPTTTSSASFNKDVAQTAHGLAVGNAIRHDGANWVKAQANILQNSGTVSVVSVVTDANNFTYVFGGFLPGGWTNGISYFLSPSVAGAIIAEPVYTDGQVREFIGTGTPNGLLLEFDLGDVIDTTVAVIANDIIGINNLAPGLKAEVALGAGTDIDWALGITFTKTLAAAWTMTFTNPVVGKTIMIVTTGDSVIAFPTGVDAAEIINYDGTKRNVMVITCVSTALPLYSLTDRAYTI